MLWVETANQIDTQVGTPPPSPVENSLAKELSLSQDVLRVKGTFKHVFVQCIILTTDLGTWLGTTKTFITMGSVFTVLDSLFLGGQLAKMKVTYLSQHLAP